MKAGQARRLDEQGHRSLVLWATDCAERALPYFEKKYPQDDRPRKAIEAGRAWARGEVKVGQARAAALAAHAAARDATDTGAIASARSSGHAAATAHVPEHARHAANYAVNAAICAAIPGADAATREREWQYSCLPERLRTIGIV